MQSKRKTFMQLLLPAFGYMIMGNVLSTVMAFSLYAFIGNTILMFFISIFAIAIYLMLVAVPAYKDGLEESVKIKSKRCKIEDIPTNRWLFVGVILFGVMLIPSFGYLFFSLNEGVYRLICGAIHPLSWILVEGSGRFREGLNGEQIELMRLVKFAPYVFMGLYTLTIPACHIGFMLGLKDKLSKGIMYK